MPEYIDLDTPLELYVEHGGFYKKQISTLRDLLDTNRIPYKAADVVARDEAIKMGAELAAMHGSDATSQQLEEAYLKGVEDGMTRRDVRPVVRGKWIDEHPDKPNDPRMRCSVCTCVEAPLLKWRFCPSCGAEMEES